MPKNETHDHKVDIASVFRDWESKSIQPEVEAIVPAQEKFVLPEIAEVDLDISKKDSEQIDVQSENAEYPEGELGEKLKKFDQMMEDYNIFSSDLGDFEKNITLLGEKVGISQDETWSSILNQNGDMLHPSTPARRRFRLMQTVSQSVFEKNEQLDKDKAEYEQGITDLMAKRIEQGKMSSDMGNVLSEILSLTRSIERTDAISADICEKLKDHHDMCEKYASVCLRRKVEILKELRGEGKLSKSSQNGEASSNVQSAPVELVKKVETKPLPEKITTLVAGSRKSPAERENDHAEHPGFTSMASFEAHEGGSAVEKDLELPKETTDDAETSPNEQRINDIKSRLAENALTETKAVAVEDHSRLISEPVSTKPELETQVKQENVDVATAGISTPEPEPVSAIPDKLLKPDLEEKDGETSKESIIEPTNAGSVIDTSQSASASVSVEKKKVPDLSQTTGATSGKEKSPFVEGFLNILKLGDSPTSDGVAAVDKTVRKAREEAIKRAESFFDQAA